MADNLSYNHDKTDDLDLISLFDRIFRFCRKYGLLVILFASAGILIGYINYKTAPKRYSSTLLLHSFTLANTEHINIIENWNELLKNKEYSALGQRLHCDPSLLKKLNKISAAEIQKMYIPNNPNGFLVEVIVTDNTILDSLQKGIVFGLENNDYLKAKLDSRRSNLTQLVEKVTLEINKLDSTKKKIDNSISTNSEHNSSFIIDVSNINTQMIALTEKLLDYQEQVKFLNAVQVLHKFEHFNKPASPKFFKSVVLGGIAGFAIGYILSIFLYVRKKINIRKTQ